MDELELLIAIVVGIFKLIRWILRTLFRGVFGILGLGKRAVSQQLRSRSSPTTRALPKSTPPAQVPASARPVTPGAGPATRQLVDRMSALAKQADAEAARCAAEEPNQPFVDSLHWIAGEAKRVAHEAPAIRDGKVLGAALANAERLDSLYEIMTLLASQRRSETLLDLLGDADALAESCYRPVVEYCRQRNIKLVSDRTATCIGGDKLFILSVDDPSGLAPIVLPDNWASEVGWWPALAHEIAHDFFNSVANLPAELRKALSLPPPNGKLPGPSVRAGDIDAAVGSWMEELFADAFGTMMLGPAYVTTMSWTFGSPSEPVTTMAAGFTKQGTFEEHPPGHVRVVTACRLLGQMGYGAVGDKLEERWRRAHKQPAHVYFLTRNNSWAALPDETVINRALDVGNALYETGLPSLSSFPLRSIPGLDFGPRENEVARGVKEGILAGRTPRVKDPRLVISGAVQAWSEKPADKARILKIARDLIDGVGVPRRRPAWAPDVDAAAQAAPVDSNIWRDAIVLDALLGARGRVKPRR